jgi:NADH-quinone oxidoreductase subunit M
MAFILLTAFILPICVMVSREAIKMEVKQFYFCLLSIELLLFAVFSVLDILGFYVVYEAILIPMVLIIGV